MIRHDWELIEWDYGYGGPIAVARCRRCGRETSSGDLINLLARWFERFRCPGHSALSSESRVLIDSADFERDARDATWNRVLRLALEHVERLEGEGRNR